MKALIFILQLIGLALLGAGPVYWWDRHPPVSFRMHVLFWHPGFDLPPSLASQRDNAVRAGSLALQSTQACRGQLDSQNASIAVLSAKSTAALARAEHDVQSHAAVAESYRQAAGVLGSYRPAGDDVCARFKDADRVVVGSLAQ
jgi:hypothetical protein